MAEYAAGTITTNGVDVPITVDDDGRWRSQYAGEYLFADTRDKLKGKLDRLTKKTKQSVEVHVFQIKERATYAEAGIRVAEAILTGIHSANGNVLAKVKIGGKWQSVQLSGWGSDNGQFAGADTTREELEEYGRLIRVRAETRKAINEWEQRHMIRPKDVVEQALKAASGGSGDEG
jgi:hypothetical protein